MSIAGLAELLRSADTTERSLEGLGGWLWESDREHRFTYLSGAVAKHAGLLAEAHYGRTRQEIGNQSRAEIRSTPWMACIERREPFGPTEFIRAAGSSRARFVTIGVPIHDPRGRFRGYSGVAFRLSEPTMSGLAAEPCRPGRVRAALVAEIILPGREPQFCVTENLSETGACLRVPTVTGLPGAFTLRLVDDGSEFHCRLRWAMNDRIGVQFLREPCN
ncbi:MAG: PAS domain-containing protein [Hyphomicrobiaceae bacterium]|nr:PAS domain-containing protein [Hyphomicrobiaceae bacterium]